MQNMSGAADQADHEAASAGPGTDFVSTPPTLLNTSAAGTCVSSITHTTASSTQGSSRFQTTTRDKEWIPSDLVPAHRNKIVRAVAEKHWGHANHMNKELPKDQPTDEELEKYCTILKKIHLDTIKILNKRLLEHLLGLSTELELPVCPEKKDKERKALTIDQVHREVLNSSKVFNQECLSRVLQCLKMPQKQERRWLQLATNDVTEQFQVRFMYDGHKKNFVEKIADKLFNDTHNQRLRRGMLPTGTVWYDRLPRPGSLKSLFGKHALTKHQQMQVMVNGNCPLHGYLVTRTGLAEQPHNVLRLEGVMTESTTEEEFVARAKGLWQEMKPNAAALTGPGGQCNIPQLPGPISQAHSLPASGATCQKASGKSTSQAVLTGPGGQSNIPQLPDLIPQAHLLPPSGATCQKASGKSTSQFGEDLVSLPEGNSSSLALGSSSVTAPPSLVDSRSTTTVVQSPPNTTTPVKALKQSSISIHSAPRPAESTCVPHKEGRLSSPCSQHVVSVNTTTSFTKPEIQNPISKQLQYVAATTCSLGALSPVTVQNKPSPGADVRDTRQQNGDTRMFIPAWGTSLVNMASPWSSYALNKVTPCGDYFVCKKGCLYQSYEHMNAHNSRRFLDHMTVRCPENVHPFSRLLSLTVLCLEWQAGKHGVSECRRLSDLLKGMLWVVGQHKAQSKHQQRWKEEKAANRQ